MLGDSDRTLPATRRRREQARQDGHVVQSRLLSTGLLLMLLAVSWNALGESVLHALAGYFHQSLSEWSVSRENNSHGVVLHSFQPVLTASIIWMASLFFGALVIIGVQTRGWFMPRFALPHASRVSPLANLRRIGASLRTRLLGVAFSIVMCGVILWIAWSRTQASGVHSDSSTQAVARVWLDGLASVTFQVATLCIFCGLVDLFLRHRRSEALLRMTPAEWAQEQRSAARGAM